MKFKENSSLSCLVFNSTIEIEEIEHSASPLKPFVFIENKSEVDFNFEVECLLNAIFASLLVMPKPLSIIWIDFFPPSSIKILMAVDLASMELSISSLTTEDGLLITSPAAI